MKIILVVDRMGWAYSTKAEALVKYYKGPFELKIVSTKQPVEELKQEFDSAYRYVFFGFQNFKKCKKFDKTMVYKHYSFAD